MVTAARKNRLNTDFIREIRNTFSRFLSILVLAALAVAFLSGLRSTAPDMQYTADNFYDRTHMMDGYVLSTLGLTDEDLDALAAAAGVESVEGCRDLDAVATDRIVNVRSMPERLNLLEVKEGRLPQAADECVTESLLLVKLGLQVGDTLELTLTEDHQEDLENTRYTIVGVVSSPLYVSLDRGTSSLGNGSVDAFVYVPGENFTFDYYTCAYFTGDGLGLLNSYGDEYEDKLDALMDSLDPLADVRAQTRYDSVIGDAQRELDDARKEFEDAKADADRELTDAWRELQDARRELDDGWADYRDGEETYAREIADAERKLADALADLRQAEIDLADGRRKYEDGLAEYLDGLKEYEDGWAEYQDGLAKYEDGKAKYEDALKAYEDGLKKYEDGLAQYEAGLSEYRSGRAEYNSRLKEYQDTKNDLNGRKSYLEQQLAQCDAALGNLSEGDPNYTIAADTKVTLTAGLKQVEAGLAQLDAGKAQLDAGAAQLSGARGELNAARRELDEAKAELDEGKKELDDALAELIDAEQELADAKKELDDAQAELDDARIELEDALAELEQGEIDLRDGWAEYSKGVADLRQARVDGRQELDDALAELNDGEREYADGLREYEDGKAKADEEIADAQQKLDDAQAELDDVDECEWYVLSRFTNAGFVGYSQDSDRVSNLANVFPLIFFLVAALACLTTMTRMVEEQRTQIGALKALGFSRLSISKKYIGYAFSASLVGGVLGLLLGRFIPLVIANAFNIMYDIPPLEFKAQVGMYVLSVVAAAVCTTGAALWACFSTLVDTPANLMRPRAPKAGKRVLLERVSFIWKRLTFTWKVTMRNLFRYQRRFWMTVIGIGGCTALIVTGFGLHESIFSILNEQFDHVFLYDATLGIDADTDPANLEAVERYLADSPWVEDWLPASATMLEVSSTGPAQTATMFAVEDRDRFTQFIQLGHRLDDEPVFLPGHSAEVADMIYGQGARPADGVVITEKLSELLGVSVGDTITLDDSDRRVEVHVADIVENYVSHYVYLSGTCYGELFGKEPEHNEILLRYVDGIGQEESDIVSTGLMAMDGVDSYSYIATLRDSFTDSMEAIDYAVVIVILAAAALAFVVLYNLTYINITERTRELATLKVLGFFDREVTAYVYRENIFLTMFGIALGLVMGRFLHAWMVLTVEVELVMFGRTAPPYAYVLAAVLTAVFSILVNIAAHFKLKKVDMVESLKTVE